MENVMLATAYLICKCGSRDFRFVWKSGGRPGVARPKIGGRPNLPYADISCGRCGREGPVSGQGFATVRVEYALAVRKVGANPKPNSPVLASLGKGRRSEQDGR